MSGVINQLKDAIMTHAAGSDWLAALTGGLWPGRAPDCAPGGTPPNPYCIFDWIGINPDHTFSENNEMAWVQFVMYGGTERGVNDLVDGCRELFGATPDDRRVIPPGFQLFEEPGTLPAHYDKKNNRFSFWTGMVQFRIHYTKYC